MSPAAATIRPATAEDARGIAEVHVAGWRWAYRGLVPDDVLASLSIDDRERMWRDFLEDISRDRSMAVAIDHAGAVVGFANTAPADAGREGIGELQGIYLAAEVQGTGVGRMLLASAMESLRAAAFRRAVLWVFTANERARRFYEAGGWAWDGTGSTFEMEGLDLPIVRYVVVL